MGFEMKSRYTPPVEREKSYPLEQRKAAGRLAADFWELSGANPDYAEAAPEWRAWFLEKLAESNEEELRGVIKYALEERSYWIKRLIQYWKRNGWNSPFHGFQEEFNTLAEEYFAARQAEAARQAAMERKASSNQTATASNEPKGAVNDKKYRIDKNRYK